MSRSSPASPNLRLVRTEPDQGAGIRMVFSEGQREVVWLLEETSVMEIMALLLDGRMPLGRRLVLDAAVTLEPPAEKGGNPHLCYTAGSLETCVEVAPGVLATLQRDIDRYLGLA